MIHHALGMAWLAAVQLQTWFFNVLSSCLEIQLLLLELLSGVLRIVLVVWNILVHSSWIHLLVDVWIFAQGVQTLAGVLGQSLLVCWPLVDWVSHILLLVEVLADWLIHILVLTVRLQIWHGLWLLLEIDTTV